MKLDEYLHPKILKIGSYDVFQGSINEIYEISNSYFSKKTWVMYIFQYIHLDINTPWCQALTLKVAEI